MRGHADVAQLVEHRFCKPEVSGSIPDVGSSSASCVTSFGRDSMSGAWFTEMALSRGTHRLGRAGGSEDEARSNDRPGAGFPLRPPSARAAITREQSGRASDRVGPRRARSHAPPPSSLGGEGQHLDGAQRRSERAHHRPLHTVSTAGVTEHADCASIRIRRIRARTTRWSARTRHPLGGRVRGGEGKGAALLNARPDRSLRGRICAQDERHVWRGNRTSARRL